MSTLRTQRRTLQGRKMKVTMSWFKQFMSLVICLSLILNSADGLSCGDAVSALIPCGSFLMGTAGASVPDPKCCEGARTLNKMAATVTDRKAMCECLKETGPSFGVKSERAKQLPTLCNIKLNIPISPDVDCSKVT